MKKEMNLPTPYYQDEAVTLYCADCRDILPLLPKVDLVLTDPPYANDTDYESHQDSGCELDKVLAEIWPTLLSKSQRILLTPGVANIWRYPQASWVLCWATPAGAGSGKWGFCCWQPILAYGPDPYLQNGMGRRPDFIEHTETAEKNGHPCPKPIRLWEKILLRGSVKETDTILDPFCGSGTTLVAAKQLGRKAIGIEISQKYCDICVKRLSQEYLL